MKKLFTSVLMMAVCLAANAQTAEFRYNGASLADGATITVKAEQDEWEEMSCNTNPDNGTAGLTLHRLTSGGMGTLSGTAHIDIQEKTLTTTQVNWCMGGQCESVNGNSYDKDFKFKDAMDVNIDDVPVQYDAILDKTHYGTMLTRLTATIGSETFAVNILFSYPDPSGISGVVADTKVVGWYTIGGQQRPTPVRGLNIAKLSNGKTVKMVIR